MRLFRAGGATIAGFVSFALCCGTVACDRPARSGVSALRRDLLDAGLQLPGFEGQLAGVDPDRSAKLNVVRLRSLARTALAGSNERNSCEVARDRALIHAAANRPIEAVEVFESLEPPDASSPWCRAERAAHEIALARALNDPLPLLRILAEDEAPDSAAARLELMNRAYALERLGLTVPAAEAWKRAARSSKEAPWRERAEAAAASLSSVAKSETWLRAAAATAATTELEPVPPDLDVAARRLPHLTRHVAIEVLLNGAGQLALRDLAAPARERITLAERLGRDIALVAGDETVGEIAREARAALDQPSGQHSFWLALTHYSSARKALREEQFPLSAEEFRLAQRALHGADSALGPLVDFGLGVTSFFLADRDSARTRMERLRLEHSDDSSSLAAHVHWSLGVIEDLSGNLREALECFDRSIALFDSLNEADGAVHVRALRAHVLVDLGREVEARRDLWTALRLSIRVASETTYEFLLDAWLRLACERHAPRASHYFLNELLRVARHSSRTSPLAHAYLMQAGDSFRALDDRLAALRDAEDAITRIADERERGRQRGLIAATRSELLLETQPARAVQEAESALSSVENLELSPLRIRALWALGRSLRSTGDLERGEQLLQRAVEELQSQLEREPDWAARARLLAEEQVVFNELADLYFRKEPRGDRAFGAVEAGREERSQERARRDSSEEIRRQTITPSEVARQVPPSTLLIEFVILDDGILWWAIRRDHAESMFTPFPRSELLQLARSLADAFAHSGSDVDELARTFSARALAPLAVHLDGATLLVVAPDPEFPALPWAALPDPRTGVPLVFKRSVTVTSGATAWTTLRARSAATPALRSVRTVGGAAFDRELLPDLPLLPQSVEEAVAVLEGYPQGELLLGASATASALFARPLPRVLHVATHAIPPASNGLLPSLVLAPEPGRKSGILSADEIGRLHLDQLHLVILAACASARGPATSRNGELGLAQSFLAAGVESVVATLWPVEDRLAKDFSLRFHDLLRSGTFPSEALRQAQLQIMGNGPARPSHPLFAYVIVGAG